MSSELRVGFPFLEGTGTAQKMQIEAENVGYHTLIVKFKNRTVDILMGNDEFIQWMRCHGFVSTKGIIQEQKLWD